MSSFLGHAVVSKSILYSPEMVGVRSISVQTERTSGDVIVAFQSTFHVTLRSRVKVSDRQMSHKRSSGHVLWYLRQQTTYIHLTGFTGVMADVNRLNKIYTCTGSLQRALSDENLSNTCSAQLNEQFHLNGLANDLSPHSSLSELLLSDRLYITS